MASKLDAIFQPRILTLSNPELCKGAFTPTETDTDKNGLLPPASLGQGNVFTGVCDSVQGGCLVLGGCSWSQRGMPGRGGVWSQHALQVSRPKPKGEVEGDLVQAHPHPP